MQQSHSVVVSVVEKKRYYLLHTSLIKYTHSLIFTPLHFLCLGLSRLPTSDLSTPTALPTMKGGRGVGRNDEREKHSGRGTVGGSEGEEEREKRLIYRSRGEGPGEDERQGEDG